MTRHGQLGVVSCVGLDTLLVRRLQDGDGSGHLCRSERGEPVYGEREVVDLIAR